MISRSLSLLVIGLVLVFGLTLIYSSASSEDTSTVFPSDYSDIVAADSITELGGTSGELAVNGVFCQIDGNRILRLWGEDYSIGFAHGYLLAEQVIQMIQSMVFGALLVGKTYEDLQTAQSLLFYWDAESELELQGMLDGIKAKLPPQERIVSIPGKLTREINLTDLKVGNTVADTLGILCSSFAGWGGSTVDSGTLIARNLDYMVDSYNYIKSLQIVISYSYSDENREDFISIGWPGAIGCYSCLNERGIAVMIHNARGSAAQGPYIPRTLAARRLTETLTPTNTFSEAEEQLESMPNIRGNNLVIARPHNPDSQAPNAAVIEYDGNYYHRDGIATVRLPAKNQHSAEPVADEYYSNLVCTNHFLQRSSLPEGGGSLSRYQTLENALAQIDSPLDLSTAASILGQVAGPNTIHSLVYNLNTMMLHIYLPQPYRNVFDHPPLEISFDACF